MANQTIGEPVIRLSKMKQFIQPLISHLKAIIQYIQDVPGLDRNAEFQQLLRKILDVTIDLDATIHDVTTMHEVTVGDAERSLEQSVNALMVTPQPP